ncbi:hypothetical protein F4775DRAFT_537900 [Biscogniauxia sp. FL1348]|nr:hypothetical protein F4775DRAFT_537900 [Biscogniauxia sp. FL1348]
MVKGKNFGRKRPILIGSNKRTDISTNTEISPTAPSYMRTPVSTPLAISLGEQNSSPSQQSTRSQRVKGYLEVPGYHSSASRYHGGLGATADQQYVALSPSTPSTSSLRTARSYTDSCLTPTSSAVTGYSPIVDQQYPSTTHHVDSQGQRRNEVLSSFSSGPTIIPPPSPSISGNQFLSQGLPFPSRHVDLSAQNMLRPPETCFVAVVGHGTTLMARNDMKARQCAILSSAVNRHRFQRHPCPRGGGFTYTTAVGYIPNPSNCLILKLEFKNVQIETSLAIADTDGPPGGPEIYLGRDFWTKFYNISSSLPDVSGTQHGSLVASPHIQSATTLPWTPGSSEAWPPIVYAPPTQVNSPMPPAGGFQARSAVPSYDYGPNDNSLMALSSIEPAGSEASVGYPPFGGPSLYLQSSYVRLDDDRNNPTSTPETIPGQYSYSLSPTNVFPYDFGTSDISGYNIGQGGMQAPNWDRPVGPGTESCS